MRIQLFSFFGTFVSHPPMFFSYLKHFWITAREDGTLTNLASQSTTKSYQARSLTLLCTSSFTTSVDPDHTFYLPKNGTLSRSSSLERCFRNFLNLTILAWLTTQFAQLFLLKLFLLLSIWKKSFLS